MITGANLLGKVDDYRKHIKRVIRILLVGILFLFVYYLRYIAANQEAVKFIDFFKMIYHNNITNAFWYLYMYLGLLIMMPLLQRMSVHMKKNDYLYLLFWIMIFMGIMPIIIHYFPDYSYCEHFNSAILPVYIGMVFAGYYVSHEVELEWKYFLWSIVIIIGCIVIQVFGTVIESCSNPDSYLFWDNRTYLPITLSAVACFYMVRYIDSKWKNKKVKKYWR